MQPHEHLVGRRSIGRILWITIVVLLLLHLAVNAVRIVTGHGGLLGILPLFDFWLEQNVPTLFNTLLLIAASALLYYVHVLKRAESGKVSWHWLVLAWAFLFLSVDEFAELHEKLSEPVQHLSGIMPGSFEHWGWVLPYALAALAALGYFLPFYLKLGRRFQVQLAIAAAMYVGGALGFEVLEGLYQAVSQRTLEEARGDILFVLLVAVEEVLEMGGVSLLICSLLEHIEGISEQHVFRITS